MTHPPRPARGPRDQSPHTSPQNRGPQGPQVPGRPPYSGSGYSRSAGYPPSGPGYGPPPGWTGFGPPPKKGPRPGVVAVLVLLAVVLVLGFGVGGIFGVRALRGADDANGPDDGNGRAAEEGSGEIFSPAGKPYRVEIPKGVVKVPLRKDNSIPSETDLSLELEDKVHFGGEINIGTLSGPAENGTFDAVGEEAARGFSSQYEGHPDQWGTGARVDKKITKLGGRSAVEIAAKFSPSGKARPSTFFRIYFIDPPSGPTILITCDWNTTDTADIEDACDSLVASFRTN